jgi:hypothetical protein
MLITLLRGIAALEQNVNASFFKKCGWWFTQSNHKDFPGQSPRQPSAEL